MAWFYLILAGLSETGWSTTLKSSSGTPGFGVYLTTAGEMQMFAENHDARDDGSNGANSRPDRVSDIQRQALHRER